MSIDPNDYPATPAEKTAWLLERWREYYDFAFKTALETLVPYELDRIYLPGAKVPIITDLNMETLTAHIQVAQGIAKRVADCELERMAESHSKNTGGK